jgi:cyclase
MIPIMARKMHAGAEKNLDQRARILRNNATHAEEILWGYLKTKPLGFKFRRQHPYSIYILDFYCHSLKIVIEIDGRIHELNEVKQIDIQRQALLEGDGLVVVRFSNDQVERELEKVIKNIEEVILNHKNE